MAKAVEAPVVCPFFGTPIRLWKTALGWFATTEYKDMGWATPILESEESLVAALKQRTSTAVPLPASIPIWTCPFTGKQITVAAVGNGRFVARVDGLWVSRSMDCQRRVEYMISIRGGIPPLFDASKENVVVGAERLPPLEMQPVQAVEDSGNVREAIERAVVESAGTRSTILVDGLRSKRGRVPRGSAGK